MNRDQLEHILRAAGAITGRTEWVIVGSQAILGAFADAPDEITVSEELDLYAPGDEHASDLIDGSIGERSPFHETFGYYAHGVGAETATLPARWRERAVIVRSEATAGVTGICPHPSIWPSASSPHGARKIRSSSEPCCATASRLPLRSKSA